MLVYAVISIVVAVVVVIVAFLTCCCNKLLLLCLLVLVHCNLNVKKKSLESNISFFFQLYSATDVIIIIINYIVLSCLVLEEIGESPAPRRPIAAHALGIDHRYRAGGVSGHEEMRYILSCIEEEPTTHNKLISA